LIGFSAMTDTSIAIEGIAYRRAARNWVRSRRE